jgi:hypothetical protein
MTKQLQEGDLALVTSGTLMGESVVLLEYVKPGGLMIVESGRVMQFLPEKGLACWRVRGRSGWVMKSPGSLMPLRSPVSNPEGAE